MSEIDKTDRIHPTSDENTDNKPIHDGIASLFASASMSSYEGAIPPAQEMKIYSEVSAELPQAIMDYAVTEQRNRHEFNMELARGILRNYDRGQIFAFSITIIAILAGVLLAFFGFPWLAGLFFSTTLVYIISLFIGKGNAKLPIFDENPNNEE